MALTWFGTRGSEVQILSPRPIKSITYSHFWDGQESRCRRFCSRSNPPSSTSLRSWGRPFGASNVLWTSAAHRHMIWGIPVNPLESAPSGRILNAPKNPGRRARGCLFTGMKRSAYKHNYDRIQRLPRSQQSRPRMEVD
jgi:hypothetical protein